MMMICKWQQADLYQVHKIIIIIIVIIITIIIIQLEKPKENVPMTALSQIFFTKEKIKSSPPLSQAA